MVTAPRPAEGYSLCVPVEVRFRDVDMMSHVNNAVYFTYFEVARTRYWKALGEIGAQAEASYVLARAECDFRHPARMGDDLGCHIRVAAFGRTSFDFEYLIRDERTGKVVAAGRTVQVMYDYGAGKVRPLDEPLKAAIRKLEGRPVAG